MTTETKEPEAPSETFKTFKEAYQPYHTNDRGRRIWRFDGLFILASTWRRARDAYCEARAVDPKPMSKDEITTAVFEAMYGVQTAPAAVSGKGGDNATGGVGDDSGGQAAA